MARCSRPGNLPLSQLRCTTAGTASRTRKARYRHGTIWCRSPLRRQRCTSTPSSPSSSFSASVCCFAGSSVKRTGEVVPGMYEKILIPIDNSKYSRPCTAIGTALAERFGSEVTGCHVYSANLHDRRFRDMEGGLPGHYQEEERLKRSRKVHDSLIGDGLRLISDAYLEAFKQECRNSEVLFNCKM